MRPSHLPRIAATGGAALLAALTLAGCGGGGNGFGSSSNGSSTSTPAAAEALYVADAGNNDIPVIALSATGTPTQLGAPSTLPVGSTAPADLILDPSRKFVLVANSGGASKLSVYTVQANGGLSATPTQTVALPSLNTQTHSAMTAVTTANGEFVYVAGSAVNTISVFQINTTTGALTAVTNAVPTTGFFSTETPATLAAFQLHNGASSQPYLLVGDQSPNVSDFLVNPDGTLTDAAVNAAGNVGPVYVAAPSSVSTGSASSDQVYAYDNGAQDLYTYQVGAGGALSQSAENSGPSFISSLNIFPNATDSALYLTQAGGTNIYEYTVNTGTGVPSTTPTQTTSLANANLQGAALDAAGRFLGVLDSAGTPPSVVVYGLNGVAVGGVLATYPLAANADPVAVATNILQQPV